MHIVLLSILLHTVYLSTNLCGITLFYPKYDGCTYLRGYKVPRFTSEQSPKSEPWELRISYSACRVIGSCNMQVKVSAWLIEHHGIKLYTTVDLWFSIFVISKANEVSVIRCTFHHSYPSRIILRYSLNRKLCGLLRYCERFRGKYIDLTVNRTKF